MVECRHLCGTGVKNTYLMICRQKIHNDCTLYTLRPLMLPRQERVFDHIDHNTMITITTPQGCLVAPLFSAMIWVVLSSPPNMLSSVYFWSSSCTGMISRRLHRCFTSSSVEPLSCRGIILQTSTQHIEKGKGDNTQQVRSDLPFQNTFLASNGWTCTWLDTQLADGA